jgi:ubiquinone biosynthesis UbiH/UbiF/VisC/COQ6 family hydroxylase
MDILIAGAGLVGMALAAALADTSYSVGIVDQALPVALPEGQLDSRIYAISPRSQRLLAQIGTWSRISAQRIAPIRQMRIAEWGKAGRLHLEALEVDADELATIVESQCLQRALKSRLTEAGNVCCLIPHQIQSISVQSAYAEVILDDQRIIHTKLLVGADGARSLIRTQMGGIVKSHDYQQQGIVANYCCEKPHQGIAYQWFFPDGILAWLPLPGNNMSMVWSADNLLAEQLLALTPEELTKKVAALGGGILGKLTMIGQPAAFPLYLTHVKQWVAPRVALVGDAAHTLHPLAGQGVNLGFGDIEVLARLLLKKGSDPGQLRLLRRYERERREAVYRMQGVTHILKALFNNEHPVLRPLRQFGLRCTDRMGFIKRQLIQAALS